MKINLNKEEYSRCAEILDVKEHNIVSAEIYIEYLNNHYNDIGFAKDEKSYFNEFLNCLEIDANDNEFKTVNKDTKISKIEKLNSSKYENDEYYSLIVNTKAKDKDWTLTNLCYRAYEGFVYNELEIDDKTFAEHTPFGYFDKDFTYPALIQNGQIWMSIIPHEIETMKEPIKNARGRVLVLGLGLGYYLYHISKKEDVKEIDVVELDQNIIDLFKKHLFNKFTNRNKINIIHEDALKYLSNNKKHYDYIFADIWHNVGDGEMLYLKIKPFEKIYEKTQFDYWIETSILAMLRRQALTVYQEQLDGLKEEEYLKARNDNDEIINRIYFYLKSTEINSFDALHNLLTESSLKEMAKYLF